MSTFTTWLFAGTGVAAGAALPTLIARAWGLARKAGSRMIERLQPAERYNSLHLATWDVEVTGKRENPEDPVTLSVRGGRATSLQQSIRRHGMVSEPLTREQRQAVLAASTDYGASGSGYRRRHPPEWTRRELMLTRLFLLGNGSERCQVYGGKVENSIWVTVCARPRWHRGAHKWQRFSESTLVAKDPGPPDN